MLSPVTAILLAAGLSTRMGAPKPLLPWDGRTLVEYQVAQLWEGGVADVVVVTGHGADAVAAPLHGSGARIVHNPGYARGRAGSVRVGAAAVPDGSAALILNVDQPRPAAITRTLINAFHASTALIVVPLFEGRRGHPALFAPDLLPELRAVAEASEGLRAVRRAHAAATMEVPMADPRVLLDMNAPDTYQRALTLFGLPAAGDTSARDGDERP